MPLVRADSVDSMHMSEENSPTQPQIYTTISNFKPNRLPDQGLLTPTTGKPGRDSEPLINFNETFEKLGIKSKSKKKKQNNASPKFLQNRLDQSEIVIDRILHTEASDYPGSDFKPFLQSIRNSTRRKISPDRELIFN